VNNDGGSFNPDGPIAETMADLWWLMLALGAGVFLLVVLLLALGLFRKRAEPDRPAAEAGHQRWWLLGGGVVLPVVLVVIVLVATVAAMRDLPSEDVPDGALVIEVVGHQWWWEVHYPDAGVTTANEIHIPVGQQVALQMTSADVIHSLWIPKLAGKLDLLPDGVNTLVLQADEADVHYTECAEFCGLQHANMDLVVVAEPQDRFAAWLDDQATDAEPPTDAVAQEGALVFLEADCGTCHTVRGTAAAGSDGPDLTHFAGRPTIGAGVAPNTRPDLTRWVNDPHSLKEGVAMPAPDLTPDELRAVLAYLETLE
jgi:cytochrome c oxidase subunit II